MAQYPLDPKSYKILDEIGSGVSAIVYKALCIPLCSSVVAIKAIDLDQSRSDFDNVRREAKAMSLLAHPNILRAHCSFTAGHRLWVVMPFMSAGSLQSIISSAFPEGLPETAIAVVLKEILRALAYLHDQGHLHRDIKAGNILMNSDGTVKLTDFGVSASIYEGEMANSAALSSLSTLTDVAGTPYWMAPEVIHSHNGYSFKADIWSFGITALELAHGRPPLSHLPPSKSLIMKITKRFKFSDYDNKGKNIKKFSKSFKDMVGSCLDQDPNKRPSAEKLLKHSFFKNCNKGSDFLVRTVLQGLPSVEQRFKESKLQKLPSLSRIEDDDDDEDVEKQGTKQRRISGWNFNEDGLELDPVMAIPSPRDFGDDSLIKQVRFGGETVIQEKVEETHEGVCENAAEKEEGGMNKEVMVGGLVWLQKSLEDQKQAVTDLIGVIRGEEEEIGAEEEVVVGSREEQLMQVVERMKMELEVEKKKNFEMEMELEFLRLQIAAAGSVKEQSGSGSA